MTPADADGKARYKKIVYSAEAMDRLLTDLFLEAHDQAPERVVLDLDATDDPVHGCPVPPWWRARLLRYGWAQGFDHGLCAGL